jgi:hypothetical protein
MKQRNFSTLFGTLLTQGMRELDFSFGDQLKIKPIARSRRLKSYDQEKVKIVKKY